MSYQDIVCEQRNRVAWIYLNRPDAMNSLTANLALELEDVLAKLEADKAVRVVVLTGKGKAFCAGADLKAVTAQLHGERTTGRDFLDIVTAALDHLRRFPKPVIAAVNGLALAGGLELTLCCDLVVAAESARMGDAHSNFGLFPGSGGAAILPRKIGVNRAKHLLFTGDFVSAAEMKDFGLVNEVMPGDTLEESVQALAERLAAKSPLVLERMKQVTNDSFDQPQEAALRQELLALRTHMRSNDIQEGLAAFEEKRKPIFKGE